MKRRVSRNIRWKRFIFVPFMIILPIVILMQGTISIEKIVGTLIAFGILVLFFYISSLPRTISFDYDFMYIERKANEEIVALKDIQVIEETSTKLSRKNLWKISYMDENKTLKSILIMPRIFQKHFDEFIFDVKALNKNVKIKNLSHFI